LSFLRIKLPDQGKDAVQLVHIFHRQAASTVSMMADIGNIPGEFARGFQFSLLFFENDLCGLYGSNFFRAPSFPA